MQSIQQQYASYTPYYYGMMPNTLSSFPYAAPVPVSASLEPNASSEVVVEETVAHGSGETSGNAAPEEVADAGDLQVLETQAQHQIDPAEKLSVDITEV